MDEDIPSSIAVSVLLFDAVEVTEVEGVPSLHLKFKSKKQFETFREGMTQELAGLARDYEKIEAGTYDPSVIERS